VMTGRVFVSSGLLFVDALQAETTNTIKIIIENIFDFIFSFILLFASITFSG